MSNSIAPGSSADINVKITALTTNPNVPVTYKTIILKKNLVNGVNTLTQEMMAAINTKYVIKYDYVLGEDITVPINCILEFDGGSISASSSNDTITSTNTGINAGLVKIFNTDVTLAGTWNVSEAYPEWFGAKRDNYSTNRNAIQKCIDSFNTIKFVKKEYYIDTTDIENVFTIERNNITLCGNGSTLIFVNTDDNNNIFYITPTTSGGRFFNIDKLNFKSNSVRKGKCVYINRQTRTIIKQCNITNFDYAIYDTGWFNTYNSVYVHDCNYGFYMNSVSVRNTTQNLDNCAIFESSVAFHLQNTSYSYLKGCASDRCEVSYELIDCRNVNIYSCGSENAKRVIDISQSYLISIIGLTAVTDKQIWDNLNWNNNLITSYITLGKYIANIKFSNCQIATTGFASNKCISFNDVGDSPFIRAVFVYCISKISLSSQTIDTNIKDLFTFTHSTAQTTVKNGVIIYEDAQECCITWNGSKWIPVSEKVGYGTWNNRPQNAPNGFIYIAYDKKAQDSALFGGTGPAVFIKDGSISEPDKWSDINGARFLGNDIDYPIKKVGTFAERPTSVKSGYIYYANDLTGPESFNSGVIIIKNSNSENRWIDTLGRVVTDNYPAQYKGEFSDKPSLSANKKGYKYFDTTNCREIIWNGTAWVDTTGVPV